MQEWSPLGGGGTGGRGGKGVPARAGTCLSWLCFTGKSGIVTVHLCLFHISIALGYSPQPPIAQLPSEPEKSPLLFSCPLGPGICSPQRFCFPDQFAAFHIDCCLFSHSGCWWTLLFIANYSSCSSAGGNTSQFIFN